jgi:DNA polymerase III alpha subunit
LKEQKVTVFLRLPPFVSSILLKGFAEYGFCKSHAAGFALLAYQSAWLKYYYPAEFYAALLNNQPMGFYTPEVIVGMPNATVLRCCR